MVKSISERKGIFYSPHHIIYAVRNTEDILILLFRIIVVQSEPKEVETDEDKFATIKPNDGFSETASEQLEQSTEQQTSTLVIENAGVNLYILAGHEDMRMQL